MSDFERNDNMYDDMDDNTMNDINMNEDKINENDMNDPSYPGADHEIYVDAEEVEETVADAPYSQNPSQTPSQQWRQVSAEDSSYHYTRETMPGGGSAGKRPSGKKNKRGGNMKKVVKIIASAFLFGLVAGGTMIGVNVAKDKFFPSNIAQVQTTDATTEAEESSTGTKTSTASQAVVTTDVSKIVDQVMPSVVSITGTFQTSSYFYGTQESEGAGSGFIIAKDDKTLYIATNNHVVEDSTSLTVGFSDGATATASIVGTDSDADLAVISVKAEDVSSETAAVIKVAVLGDSDSLKVGESVIAIGNALGYGQSVTTGVISAKDREVSFTDGTLVLLQTDAAINPGNSGGVLVNQNGEVIGINNAKLEDTSVEGMGYAIPMSTAKEILNDLMNSTTISEEEAAFLGVVGKTIDSTYSEALGMPSGIYVSQVVSGSPAESAGISAGDVITGLDGNTVSTMDGLKSKLERKKAGTKVEITLQRANQNGEYEEQTLEVTLGKKSDFADETTDTQQSQDQQSQDQQSQDQQNQQGNGYDNGQDNGQYGNGSDSGESYIDPFEYFFGNGSGNSNNYYYYGNN